MKVIYPTLFYEEENGKYSIFIPDFDNVSTYANNLESAMNKAEELIAKQVLKRLNNGDCIPEESRIENVSHRKLEETLEMRDWQYVSKFKTYICVDIDEYIKKWGTDLVKKTVNIPRWINTRAEEMRINFSQTLEEALMEKISRKKKE